VKKGIDKCSKKIKDAKHADASVDATKPTPASSIFAVYKNYKSGATAATAAADSNGSVGNNSKKVILKDNVNKFIFKGRIDDYALDVKAREKKENSSNKTKNEQRQKDGEQQDDDTKEEMNISYSEFKKRNVNKK
jgi:osmotically-inducible protein OsmY